MSTPFVGEIRMFAGNFAPVGWMLCNGDLLSIAENDSLFIAIGTTYGGDGQTTFAIPNLQSRVPIHQGNGFTIGETGGSEAVTLTAQQMPTHTHVPSASNVGGSDNPAGSFWGFSTLAKPYQAPAGPGVTVGMNAGTVGAPTGGSQPHENMIPFLCINYIISLFGIQPHP